MAMFRCDYQRKVETDIVVLCDAGPVRVKFGQECCFADLRKSMSSPLSSACLSGGLRGVLTDIEYSE